MMFQKTKAVPEALEKQLPRIIQTLYSKEENKIFKNGSYS
jgi:cation transport regulator ChaB